MSISSRHLFNNDTEKYEENMSQINKLRKTDNSYETFLVVETYLKLRLFLKSNVLSGHV